MANPDERRGIDYDLSACLEYNCQPGFTEADIERVLAVVEGEPDGDSWHWILRLSDGRHVYLSGWCDFTGWDCQSAARSVVVESEALALAAVVEPKTHGDMVSQIQLRAKAETWDERSRKDFGP